MSSAVEEVLEILRAAIGEAGLSVAINRKDSDILQSDEYPVTALSWLGAEMKAYDSASEYMWDARIAVDCWAKVAPQLSVISQVNEALSAIAQVVQDHMEHNNFDNKFHDCFPISVGDFEALNENVGAMTLTLAVQFRTSKRDWSTILNY